MDKVRLSLVQRFKEQEKLREGKISSSLYGRRRGAGSVQRAETGNEVKPRKRCCKGVLERRQVFRTPNGGEEAGCDASASFANREVMYESGSRWPEGPKEGLELRRCEFSAY
jgi:hypothetical protein